MEEEVVPVAIQSGLRISPFYATAPMRWSIGYDIVGAIYPLTVAAKLKMLDPEDDLWQMLERIAEHPAKPVHELLPWILTSVRARLNERNAA